MTYQPLQSEDVALKTCCNGTLIEEGRYKECECSRKASLHALLGLWDALVDAWPLYAWIAFWTALVWWMTA